MSIAPPPAFDDDTYAWGYAPPSHLAGEPAVPIPDKPPGADIAPNQPVKLPSGVVAYRETYGHRERMMALDKQAQDARQASQQAMQDAQMFEQMSRVAKSTKDIEIARRSIDVMGLQRDIQSGVPIHQAVARHPMALGSGYGSALQHTAPASEVPSPSVVNLPGMPPAIRSGRYGERVQFPPGTGQQPAHKLGEVIPLKDPATGADIGRVIATGPQTGHFEKSEGVSLTPSQQVQVQRARITAIQAQLNNAYTITDKKAREKMISDNTAELANIYKDLTALPNKTAAPAANVPRVTSKSFAVPGQGTRDDPARPETDEQFNSIPSGLIYKNPKDGKLYRKK